MNWALFHKEWSGLRLSVWLAVAFSVVQLVYVLVSKFPDRYDETIDLDDAIFSCVFFGILVGVTAFGQERDQGTLSFLDGLPVSRWLIFGYKVFAASLVLTLAPLAAVSLEAVFQWLSLESTSPALQWSKFAKLVLLQTLVGMAVAGAAACLSFTRKWFPLFAGITFLSFLWFRTTSNTVASALNTPVLFEWFTSKQPVGIPTKQLIGHGAFALVAWWIAGIAFQVRDGWATRTMDRMATWRFAGWLTGLAQLMAAIVWISSISLLAPSDSSSRNPVESRAAGTSAAERREPTSDTGASFSGSEDPGSAGSFETFGQLKTSHYELIFRERQRANANAIYWSLDAVYDDVKQYFENPDGSSFRIVLDTGSAVSSHVAGQTNWTKIRVPFHLAESNDDFLQTVRHETAHVFIEQMSGGRAKTYFEAMRLFHEGLATSCQVHSAGDWSARQRVLIERWAVGNDSRGRIQLPKLCTNSDLEKDRHTFVVYPLGFVMAESLREMGGAKLPRRMLEVLRETPLPPGVKPEELWRILLQKSGSSSDLLMATYAEKLDELAKREARFLARLPRLEGKVQIEGEYIVIRPQWDKELDKAEEKQAETSDETIFDSELSDSLEKSVICEVERDLVLANLPQSIRQESDGTFRLRRDSVASSKIRYVLGWSTPESAGPIWEPWTEFTLP